MNLMNIRLDAHAIYDKRQAKSRVRSTPKAKNQTSSQKLTQNEEGGGEGGGVSESSLGVW